MAHAPDHPAVDPRPAALQERLDAAGGLRGRERWRSLEELAGDAAFREMLAREFPPGAAEPDAGMSRRRFLELGAASLALAGLTSCTRQPAESIVPYVKQPEEVVPGRPLFFATAMTLGGYATGILVESHLGRPTKVEGNPEHPASLGATDLLAQASVLGLYDPDRSQAVTHLGEIRAWSAFAEALAAQLRPHRALGGEGLRILTGAVTSPTLASQLREVLTALPNARWHAYEPAGRDAALDGAVIAFGEPAETRYDFSLADVIVTLDGDPFAFGPGHVRYAREFARRRRASVESGGPPVRLWAAESCPTCTGSLADHRLPLAARDLPLAAAALAAELGISGIPRTVGPDPAVARWVAAAAADLKRAGARGVVFPGEFAPPAVHALAHAIHGALGSLGKTAVATAPAVVSPVNGFSSLAGLAADMRAGKVDTLLILGGNPVFDAPADLGFKDALLKVPFRARLGLHDDETSEYCHWQVPEAHFLETWGDARAHDGTVTIQQPLIEPLYGGRSAHEVLAVVTESQLRSAADIVKAHWRSTMPAEGFEAAWRRALHDGVVPGTALAAKAVTLRADDVRKAIAAAIGSTAPAGSIELNLRPDPGIHDGRFANNGWLQEAPRPFSKIVWDNAAYLSFATASRLGVKNEDVIEITAGGRKLEVPAWILPGHADDSITLHFGHGRSRAGKVGSSTGVNVYALRGSDAPWNVPAASVRRTGGTRELATTQHHFNMEGRDLVRTGTLAGYRKNPDFVHAHEAPSGASLYEDFKYEGHAWGLVVNLSACNGCNACVLACQAENNIPIVGKDQVRRGREMHWIRIDRYHEGAPEDPAIHNQPVLCMHCEKAPCEVVCPVAATTHSAEGLNEMTYNRCVGTKYCSNNCPYKVRRFNFYELNADKQLPVLTLLANPDVTVRQRGVMEKCTYCVQRINEGRMAAEKENRRVRDGEVVTACQQVCPSEALVFGDINDPSSRVARLRKEKLNYALLAELNTRPRTTYLAKLTNPSPDLGAAERRKEGGG